MKFPSSAVDQHEEPLNALSSSVRCVSPPQTRTRRPSYLPSSPQGRKMIPSLFGCSAPSTPTHRLRPPIEPLESPLSMSNWMDQSPCSTPTTPRRRLAALLDTPGSNVDRSGALPSVLLVTSHCNKSPRKSSLFRSSNSSGSSHSNHSSGQTSPKRRLPTFSSLEGPSPVPSPASSPSQNSLSPRKRKSKLSL
eukprot:scaffold42491_cov160-Amphora_coffeaeformis.AAC.1